MPGKQQITFWVPHELRIRLDREVSRKLYAGKKIKGRTPTMSSVIVQLLEKYLP